MTNLRILLLTIVIFVSSIGIGRLLGDKRGTVKSVSTTAISYEAPTVTPTDTPVPISNPITLTIPAIGVTAPVEQVGLDIDQRMDVPKEDMNVGWYNLGPKPGETGSAVLAGHFDTRTGGPAVFYKLDQVQVGDTIEVETTDGEVLEFEVVETQHVKDSEFPLAKVFTRSDAVRLNLITCAGTFNTAAKNYDERFIVYSVLKATLTELESNTNGL